MRKWRGFAACAGWSMVFLLGADFWEKPFTEWKREEVLKLLNKSPWADHMTFTRQTGVSPEGLSQSRTRGGSLGGERELYDTYTVRFFSALPVRQAYVRMLQFMNGYDEMRAEQKKQFDNRFSRVLKMDTSQSIIVALEFSSNDRQLAMNVERMLQQNTAELLKQKVYLISQQLGRVELTEYYPPAADGTGAKFLFPRIIDGKPVVSPQDKEVKFEFYVPGPLSDGQGRSVNHKVYLTWKIKDMIYKGELAL